MSPSMLCNMQGKLSSSRSYQHGSAVGSRRRPRSPLKHAKKSKCWTQNSILHGDTDFVQLLRSEGFEGNDFLEIQQFEPHISVVQTYVLRHGCPQPLPVRANMAFIVHLMYV